MTPPELLAPAGNLEKLRCALDFGADAVYAGLEDFSLRSQADNLSWRDFLKAREQCRERERKLYLTLNAYFRQDELPRLTALVRELAQSPPDALIVSDPGAIAIVRREAPELPLHLSTQANTVNAASVNFWQSQGISRVNLARELSLAEIAVIGKESAAELEVFVHGAMCMAWSGRCLLSAALTERSANRGNCSHPCRWRYALVEESRPGEYFPIEEDQRGSYLLNSRDLCLIDELPALLDAGVASLKIEGRMKSLYYVAAVTRVYRDALDRLAADRENWRVDPAWLEELDMVSHRPYTKGLQDRIASELFAESSRYIRRADFLGRIERLDGKLACLTVRNRFFPGEQLELIGPDMRTTAWAVDRLCDEERQPLTVAQPNQQVWIGVAPATRPGDILRRNRPAPPDSV